MTDLTHPSTAAARRSLGRAGALMMLLLVSAPASLRAEEEVPPAADSPMVDPVQEPAAPPRLAQTTADDVRLRAGPSINFRVLERVPRGTWLLLGEVEGEFTRVRVPGGVPAYIHADLVRMDDDLHAVVERSDVLLRPTAGKEYFPLEGQRLQKGERLRVLGKEPGEGEEWLKVLTPEAVEVFVHTTLLAEIDRPSDWEKELSRAALARRDGYTGGREAEEALAAEKAREEGFARDVQTAAERLSTTPADAVPEGLSALQQSLKLVMTESGDADVRNRAAMVARELLLREKTVELARLKAEKSAVKETLEGRLAEAENRYRAALADLLRAAPERESRRFMAIGYLRRDREGFYLEKGGVVLHRVDSLRYDLEEMLGRNVGVNGRRIEVDPRQRLALLRVDSLEIL